MHNLVSHTTVYESSEEAIPVTTKTGEGRLQNTSTDPFRRWKNTFEVVLSGQNAFPKDISNQTLDRKVEIVTKAWRKASLQTQVLILVSLFGADHIVLFI